MTDMRCDDIRERFIELIYAEPGTPPPSPELLAHVSSCPSCQSELGELRRIQSHLRLWEDEEPLRGVQVPKRAPSRSEVWLSFWHAGRKVAVAASFVLALLALGNAEVSWEKGRFSFKTRLIPGRDTPADYYTKSQTKDLVRMALDDTEGRMMETNYLMMQRVLETMEQERWNDLRLMQVRQSVSRGRN